MKLKVLSFIALVVLVYMCLTLGIKIAEQFNITVGVCFAGVTTTICVLGYQWVINFLHRREAEAERRRKWAEISAKMAVAGNKIYFHHDQTDLMKSINEYYYLKKRDGDVSNA